MTCLFVYGTLAPGRPNAHVLADVSGDWEPGAVRGRLLEAGWGAGLGFPGIELEGDGEVQGLLFTSEQLGEHWLRLDEFEGDEYERVLTQVRMADGRNVEAHIYAVRS